MDKNKTEKLGKEIVDACVAVHREMGPGLLESVYELCLIKELGLRSIKAERQVDLPLTYKGQVIAKEFKIDILIEDEIIIEIKSVESILPVHQAQIISYLKLANKKLGFLVNFNVPLLKHGIKRFVNNY